MAGSRVAVTLLGFYSIFFSAECLSFPGGGECGLSKLSFGGRLMLPNRDGTTHQWDNRRAFIFQSPQGRSAFGGHGGRGRIWVTLGQPCRGTTTQQQHCPVRESIPCMDSSMPCSFDFGPPPAPSYTEHSPLVLSRAIPGEVVVIRPEWNQTVDIGEGPVTGWTMMYRGNERAIQNITKSGDEYSHSFNLRPGTVFEVRIALENTAGDVGSFTDWQRFTTPCADLEGASMSLTTSSRRDGFAKVIANWEYQNSPGACAVKNQTIRFLQLNRDNCSPEETGELDDVLRNLDTPEERDFAMRALNANSLFRVTVTVVTMTDQAFEISENIRTATTGPSGRPIIGDRINLRGGRMKFTWFALPCGERNADNIDYDYTLVRNGQQYTNTGVLGLQSNRIGPVTSGQSYTFKVRAHSEEGYGEYSEETGTF